jgi:hypothetical protein
MADINTTGNVLCLPGNSRWSKSSAAAHALTDAHRTIIGYSDGSSRLDSNAQTGSLISLDGITINGDITVANITLTNIKDSSWGIAINSINAASVRKILINNVRGHLANTSATAIKINNINDVDVFVFIENSQFSASGAAVKIIDSSNSSHIYIDRVNIDHSGPSGQAISFSNPMAGGVDIALSFTNVAVRQATAFEFQNGTASDSGTNKIFASRFKRLSVGSSATPLMKMSGKLDYFTIENNILFSEVSNSALLDLQAPASPAPSFKIIGNSFIQTDSSAPAILVAQNTLNISEFSKNSFSYSNPAASNSIGPISVSSATTLNAWTTISSFGENLICSAGSTYSYTSNLTNSGAVGGGLGLTGIPNLTNNMDLTSGRCKGP